FVDAVVAIDAMPFHVEVSEGDFDVFGEEAAAENRLDLSAAFLLDALNGEFPGADEGLEGRVLRPRFAGLGGIIRLGAGSAGRGEADGAEKCCQRASHCCSPLVFGDSDIAVERGAKVPRIALVLLDNLDEITASVVKNGCGDRSHVHGGLSESNSRADEAFVFRVHVIYLK